MILTCNSCSFRKDCGLKRGYDAVLKDARESGGLRIASISIHCDRRLSLLPLGQPVEVMALARWVNNGDEEDSIEAVKRTATVIGNSSKNPRKLRVWLDEPAGFDSMIRSLWPKDVTPIAGPLRAICPGCGLRPIGAPAPETWGCEVCRPSAYISGVLTQFDSAAELEAFKAQHPAAVDSPPLPDPRDVDQWDDIQW